MSTSRCKVCDVKKSGCTDFCRTHKFAVRRANKRVRAEDLLVDQAGGAWWIWDKIGNVLVIGENTKAQALAQLAIGDSP